MSASTFRKPDIIEHYPERNPPIVFLDCKSAFNALTDAEKLYAFHLVEASWTALPICCLQCSPESPGLFLLLINIFSKMSPEEIRKQLKCDRNWEDDEIEELFLYIAAFFGNLGNYLSFGDMKILPGICVEKFSEFVDAYATSENDKLIWEKVMPMIYNEEKWCLTLGFRPDGLTNYYSANCVEGDAKTVQEYMNEENISGYNTRLFKTDDDYVVMQAGANRTDVKVGRCGDHNVSVRCGDYWRIMKLFVDSLGNAKMSALNSTQTDMLTNYIKSFTDGNIESHKRGSICWVKDKGPIVETYLGFIESYRDPYGVRGEFESFVACVNKETSKVFARLVDNAESLLKELPWPSTYEKDTFLRPDFTALDIIAFAVSGIPVGINIPNYDDIRQNVGFKNVSLKNVLESRMKIFVKTFLCEADRKIYNDNIAAAFDVQVALHELLGHGSGKLFTQSSDGTLNFDREVVEDMLLGGPVTSWYKPGQTWDSVFSSLSSPYEECRAESVAIYLSTLPHVLEIFGQPKPDSPDEITDTVYVNWLSMARSGLVGLIMYQKNNKKFGQAHCAARFAILRVLLEAGENFVEIEEFNDEDGKPNLTIKLDRSKILTVGRPAVGEFLRRLQFYKSTADVAGGSEFFSKYVEVPEFFLRYKDIIYSRKEPRAMIVQGNLELDSDNRIVSVQHDATYDGMITSYVTRYAGRKDVLDALEETWKEDMKWF